MKIPLLKNPIGPVYFANCHRIKICLLLGIFGIAGITRGEILFVQQGATGANNGTSWENAYAALQDALTVAQTGDEIWVARGTYRPTSGADRLATFQLKNGVALYGGFDGTEGSQSERSVGDNETVLSGDLLDDDNDNLSKDEPSRMENSVHVVTGSGTDATAILDGFTIAGGNANASSGMFSQGGGIFIESGSPTVSNCSITRNTAAEGGGMHNLNGSRPIVTGCIFTDNSAFNPAGGGQFGGGGMHNRLSAPTVRDCTFSNNTTDLWGGGVYNDGLSEDGSAPSYVDCIFSRNSAHTGAGMHNEGTRTEVKNCEFIENSASWIGGGMVNRHSTPILTDCSFTGNSAFAGSLNAGGGGIDNFDSYATLINCVFRENSAGAGGGLRSASSNLVLINCAFSKNSAISGGGISINAFGDPTIVNCIFTGNTATDLGGAMHSLELSYPTIVNCIFHSNTAALGGGIASIEDLAVANSIFWNNRASSNDNQIHNANLPSVPLSGVTYSLLEGGYNGQNNVDGDPMLVDTDVPAGADGRFGTEDDGLRLQEGSPAIDAGNGAALPADVADIDGDSDTGEPLPFDFLGRVRVAGDSVDLGAYEFGAGFGLLWGGAVDLGRGWMWLQWFGFWNAEFEPWIYHRNHGWMFVNDGSTDAAMWLLDPTFGWLFTASNLYPNLFSDERKGWIFYFVETIDPRVFVESGSGEFFTDD